MHGLISRQYFLGTQMISFILIAPWLATTDSYDDVFEAQPRLVNKSWYVPSDAIRCVDRSNR